MVALVLAVLALAGGAYWLLRPPPAGGPPQGDFAVPVEAATLATQPIERIIPTVGSLRSNESVMIAPEVAGRLATVSAEEGQRVAAGTEIAVLDQDIPRAELAQIDASLALSRANYDRAVELLERSAGTVRARDEALAKLRADQAALALAKARLDKTRIMAPFDGVLGLRRASVGQYLAPGEAIFNLEAIDPLKVDFRLPETAFAAVRVGQTVTIHLDAFPGETFTGDLYAIDPMIDEAGRSIAARARVANGDSRLRPGLFARVDLVYETKADALLLPEQALVPMGAETMVFRIIDGKATATPVKLGERFGAMVEVLSGLAAGDQVVTAGQIKLRDGAPVAVLPPSVQN